MKYIDSWFNKIMKKNTEKIESLTKILEQIDFLLGQQEESESTFNFVDEGACVFGTIIDASLLVKTGVVLP